MRVGDTASVTIIGAGLAGTLLAVLLAQRGFRVELFERNPDQRSGDAPAGRSINLALAERGRHALRKAGLLEFVEPFTIPMRGRMLHDPEGRLTLQPYGKDAGEVIYSTHRAMLNNALLEAADATGNIRMHFNHALQDICWERRELRFAAGPAKTEKRCGFEVLIGADGGGSAVRKAMDRDSSLGVSEERLDHGYLELTIPPSDDGNFRMDANALHIWPRGGFMLIALPNSDGSFTATLFLPRDAEPGFRQLVDWPGQLRFMREHFTDAIPLLGQLKEDFAHNPVGLLGTIRCRLWHRDGQAALLGDAAHAVVPFHGQGMNAAFEDCVELAGILENSDQDWAEAFALYQQRRISNANAIADMALENYGIMRESVRDPRFLLRKSLEHELERRHPDRFVARYSLVMFHRVPYREAFERGQEQAKLLDDLLQGADSLEDVDFGLAARLIGERLPEINEPAD